MFSDSLLCYRFYSRKLYDASLSQLFISDETFLIFDSHTKSSYASQCKNEINLPYSVRDVRSLSLINNILSASLVIVHYSQNVPNGIKCFWFKSVAFVSSTSPLNNTWVEREEGWRLQGGGSDSQSPPLWPAYTLQVPNRTDSMAPLYRC